MRENGWRAPVGILTAAVLISFAVSAAPLSFVPQTVRQPDGTLLQCFASGDEFNNWLHDAAGFTILQDPKTGVYVYAVRAGDRLAPSSYVPGTVDPASVGLEPWLNIPPAYMMEQREAFLAQSPAAPAAPSVGSIRNVVVFIRFADEAGFERPFPTYDAMFNASSAGANSMRNYFAEASYGRVLVTSWYYPAPAGSTVMSYQDSHVRAYYQPKSVTNPDGYDGGNNGSERTSREHTLLAEAIAAVNAGVPDSLDTDADNDGRVDNVCFVVTGKPNGWSSLLWPHKWALYTSDVRLQSKRVWEYNLQLDSSMNNGVLAHEMFHTFGAPDLYHYTGNGISPVGSWDVMESNRNPPQHMSAYMKYKYGKWIPDIPALTSEGTYTLKPLTSSTNNAYRIPSPYSSTEYFVVEYRRKRSAFENSIPGEGLVVYRINTAYSGNASGPPDEVYAYRPDGTPAANGSVGKAAFSLNSGRTSISDSTNPSSFLTSGDPGGLHITSVGAMGDTIAFTLGKPISVRFGAVAAVAVSPDTVRLTWSTLLERANAGFEIERSKIDSGDYEPLPNGMIPGNSPSLGTVEYAAVDENASGYRYYRVKQTDSANVTSYSTPVKVETITSVAPDGETGFALAQNYPNPFNPSTEIRFSVGRSAPASLRVYDLLGRVVATLFDEVAQAGRLYTMTFDAAHMASGVYLYALTSGGTRDVKRLMVVK
jgi:M6 family metalloprotease-like protein